MPPLLAQSAKSNRTCSSLGHKQLSGRAALAATRPRPTPRTAAAATAPPKQQQQRNEEPASTSHSAHSSSSSSSSLAALRVGGRAAAASLTAALATWGATAAAAAAEAGGSSGGSAADVAAFELVQSVDAAVSAALAGAAPAAAPATLALVAGAGLLTSLSPCTLSVLPLTVGYIAGYAAASADDAGEVGAAAPAADANDSSSSTTSSSSSSSRSSSTTPAAAAPRVARPARQKPGGAAVAIAGLSFSAGLASSLAALGVAGALAGRAYGTALGPTAPLLAGGVAIVMGLNLLGALPLTLPSLNVDGGEGPLASAPPAVRAYAAGAAFALAASPCATPILATLLAYVSATGDPLSGGALLLAYSAGYVAPLLVAASVTGAATRLLTLRAYSSWVTPASGVLLVAGGTYAVLSRLVPA